MELEQTSSKNTTITASVSDQFDYENIKQKFNQQISNDYSKKVSIMTPYWTEVVFCLIKAIVDAEEGKIAPEEESLAVRAKEIYDVVNQDEQQLLVLKKKNKDGGCIVVVPNEDCFDLLVKIHLDNNHADQEKMLQIIKKKYLIRDENVRLLLELCNVCKINNQICPKEVKRAYYVFFIDLFYFRDEPYPLLLVLVEQFTGFFHLRPLVFKDPSEIAIELFKIYSDYGPPNVLMTPIAALFVTVNSIISKMCPIFSVDVKEIDQNEILRYDDLVKNELCEWISMTGSTNWATGSRMLQWKMNNIETNRRTPYEIFVGSRPNDSLYLNPVWLRIRGAKVDKFFIVDEFKRKFQLYTIEMSSSESVVEESSDSNSQDSQESGVDGSMVTEDNNFPKCIICLHPVHRLARCSKCSKPMHAFCGTRFSGTRQLVHNMCMKCKNEHENVKKT